MGEESKSDAKARPAPMEFPDWKEMETIKILIPINEEATFPYRNRIVSIMVFCVENPYRVDMTVNAIMKQVANIMTHSRLY